MGVAALSAATMACAQPARPPGPAEGMRTDSLAYTVRAVDDRLTASIGFTYTNRGAESVSRTYCRVPTPPVLEKYVAGSWVLAYSGYHFLCKTIPPLIVPVGGSYRGLLKVLAVPRGCLRETVFEVDSIPGEYRLHWILKSGSDPSAPGAPDVHVISNSFSLRADDSALRLGNSCPGTIPRDSTTSSSKP